MSTEFEPNFKTRLVNKIDETIGQTDYQTYRNGLAELVEDYVELSHDERRIRMEVEDVIEQIKSGHWDIESAEDVRSGLDDWDPTEEVYTAAQEEAVYNAGISECFTYISDHYGDGVDDLNGLYNAVYWDMKQSISAAFITLAEEVEEEEEGEG